jgi:hypothetical protein
MVMKNFYCCNATTASTVDRVPRHYIMGILSTQCVLGPVYFMSRRIVLMWLLRKHGARVLTGFIWLRIGTSGRVL